MKRVAIFGCGPAGMLAGHAAKMMKHQVTIFSRKQKSAMLGAQYMHRSIPHLSIAGPVKLEYMLEGTIEGYREKIYGDVGNYDELYVSPQLFIGTHEAWSIRECYNLLWFYYNHLVMDVDIDQRMIQTLVGSYDVIISTIPAPLLCYQPERHQFKSVSVYIDDLWNGPATQGDSNIVICNGRKYDERYPGHTGWYRTSLIFGHSNTEWISQAKVPNSRRGRGAIVRKPISTDCDCWPQIIRTGRYGAWRKGVLSHEAFELALEVLSQ